MARTPSPQSKPRGRKGPSKAGRPKKTVPAVNDRRALLVTELANAITATDLSDTDKRILAVRLIPESVHWSIPTKCKWAGVSERTWYRHNLNPAIQEYVTKICGKIADSHLPEILNRLNHDAVHCLFAEDRARAAKVVLPYTSLGMALASKRAPDIDVNLFMGSARVPVEKMSPDQRLAEAADHLRAAGWTVVPPPALPAPNDDRLASRNQS